MARAVSENYSRIANSADPDHESACFAVRHTMYTVTAISVMSYIT